MSTQDWLLAGLGSLWAYSDVGRVHLSLSGSLLETLASPGFQGRRA